MPTHAVGCLELSHTLVWIVLSIQTWWTLIGVDVNRKSVLKHAALMTFLWKHIAISNLHGVLHVLSRALCQEIDEPFGEVELLACPRRSHL